MKVQPWGRLGGAVEAVLQEAEGVFEGEDAAAPHWQANLRRPAPCTDALTAVMEWRPTQTL